MSKEKSKPAKPAAPEPARPVKAAAPIRVEPPPETRGPLYRRVDWLAFGVTTAITLLGYLFTLAPDLTLEDSGELAVGSYYAAVPHAPGYPVWTIYTWLFTVLLPFSNVAWRVAVSSAVAAALANGLLALLVSRGSSMIIEGIQELKTLEQKWENRFCLVAGLVSGILIGYNGFMWSQAVIVEVYTLSVLSLMGVLACMMHYVYTPTRRRYLYLAFFLFGICFNNHQTLIVAAIGLEVMIAAAQPRLGRDLFLANSAVYVIGLILKGQGVFTTFDNNAPLFVIYNFVGLGSIGACAWLTLQTKQLFTEWRPVLILLGCWLAGAAFYFYMPLTSSTNPPMNWGYPRTWEGFVHAFTRGQYEKTNPTNIFQDPWRFLLQIKMYFAGAIDEFSLAFLLLALVPFFFYARMQQRERAWLVGNSAIYLCLAFLLLILLNPTTDKQSKDLTKVFFTASHVTLAMFLGYGLTIVGAMIVLHYERFRVWGLYGGAVMAATALYSLATKIEEVYADPNTPLRGLGLFLHGLGQVFAKPYFTAPIWGIYAALLVLVASLVFVAFILLQREKLNPAWLLGLYAAMPLYSLLSHWPENEQRGHLFGFYFGHHMFTPTVADDAGQPLYPEMTRDAVLFGGTDPGRFCPTYMIFCESFIKPSQRRDPNFDRRDVYIITQNALADGTYLNYIRAHYNRSTQIDPPFFQDFFLWLQNLAMGRQELERKFRGEFHRTNGLARFIGSFTNVAGPFDRALLAFGARVEQGRRARGVYPPKEIHCPSPEDSQRCFGEYINDVQRRFFHDQQNPGAPRQLKPGEDVQFGKDGRVQVQGQVAVMAINALLTKVIFDQNPHHEFFVEESFPLEWMYPYLTPFGIIMKINREPLPSLSEEIVARDHEYWTRFSSNLCGNWITYDTPMKEICDFAVRTYLRGDLTGYTGDPKFVRDNDAQKAFSKLRNAIAGVYMWRVNDAKTADDRARMIREADFAFKQAFAFCPYSPEAVFRYVNLLYSTGRLDDAILMAETALRFDADNASVASLIDQLRQMHKGLESMAAVQSQLTPLESAYASNRTDVKAAFALVGAYIQLQRTNEAYAILDGLVAQPQVDAGIALSVANAYLTLNLPQRMEPALQRLVTLVPDNAEAWYDLAGSQATLGKYPAALQSLTKALQLSQQRLATNPAASNLNVMAVSDPRFVPLRNLPEFRTLLAPR